MGKSDAANIFSLHDDMKVAAALRLIVTHYVQQLKDNIGGVAANGDVECVHRARVALRRLRSADKAFSKMLSAPSRKGLLVEVQWFSALLGNLRDLQILLEKTLPPIALANSETVDFEILQMQLQQRAARALVTLSKALHSKRYQRLMSRLEQWAADNTDATPTKLPKFARRALKRRYRRVDALAQRWDQLASEERHTLRKHVKKLRYAIDIFASLYRPKEVAKYLKSLEHLQTALGEANDIVAAQTLLQPLLRNTQTATAASATLGWLSCTEKGQYAAATIAVSRWRRSTPFWD